MGEMGLAVSALLFFSLGFFNIQTCKDTSRWILIWVFLFTLITVLTDGEIGNIYVSTLKVVLSASAEN